MRKIKGELEIDSDRGVIYFTAYPPKNAPILRRPKWWLTLRICQLPTPITESIESIDIIAGDVSYTHHQ